MPHCNSCPNNLAGLFGTAAQWLLTEDYILSDSSLPSFPSPSLPPIISQLVARRGDVVHLFVKLYAPSGPLRLYSTWLWKLFTEARTANDTSMKSTGAKLWKVTVNVSDRLQTNKDERRLMNIRQCTNKTNTPLKSKCCAQGNGNLEPSVYC